MAQVDPSRPVSAWLRDRPVPFRRAFAAAWRCAGIACFVAPCGARVLRLGRAAARLDGDGTVATTEFLRDGLGSDRGGNPFEAASEAAWRTDAGGVFNDARTEVPSALDGGGTAAAAAGWADFLSMLRVALSREPGGLEWLRAVRAISVTPGFAAPVRTTLDPSVAQDVAALLDAAWAPSAAKALSQWRANFDLDLLSALERAGLNSPAAWNAATRTPERGQAARAFPWALRAAISEPALRRAVDERRPLAEALAARFGVSTATVRRAGSGLPGAAAGRNPGDLLRRVESLGPQVRLPRTSWGWIAFAAVAGYAPERLWRAACAGAAEGEWDASGPLARGAREIPQLLHALGPCLLAPLAAWGAMGDQETAVLLARSPRTLAAWVARHEEWGAADAARLAAAAGTAPVSEGEAGWTRLHPTWRGSGGIIAEPLSSQAELAREAVAMGHCVNTYADKCRDGGCHIVAFRDAAGGRDGATAEVDAVVLERALAEAAAGPLPLPPRPAPPPAFLQLKGPGNESPSPRVAAAAWEWFSAAAAGTLPGFDASAAALDARARREAARGRGAAAPVPPMTAALATAILDGHGPLLPRALRRRLARVQAGGDDAP